MLHQDEAHSPSDNNGIGVAVSDVVLRPTVLHPSKISKKTDCFRVRETRHIDSENVEGLTMNGDCLVIQAMLLSCNLFYMIVGAGMFVRCVT